jgi:hypothetical protein
VRRIACSLSNLASFAFARRLSNNNGRRLHVLQLDRPHFDNRAFIQGEMNSRGTRQETIEILKWGDPEESLQFLRRYQDYKHIKRMVLEPESRNKEAASLR